MRAAADPGVLVLGASRRRESEEGNRDERRHKRLVGGVRPPEHPQVPLHPPESVRALVAGNVAAVANQRPCAARAPHFTTPCARLPHARVFASDPGARCTGAGRECVLFRDQPLYDPAGNAESERVRPAVGSVETPTQAAPYTVNATRTCPACANLSPG